MTRATKTTRTKTARKRTTPAGPYVIEIETYGMTPTQAKQLTKFCKEIGARVVSGRPMKPRGRSKD